MINARLDIKITDARLLIFFIYLYKNRILISYENVNYKNVGHIKLHFFLFPFYSILFYFISFIYVYFFFTFLKRKTFLRKQFFSINIYFANKNKELGTIVNVRVSLHFVHLIRNINNKSTFEVEKVLHNWIFLISSWFKRTFFSRYLYQIQEMKNT